MRRKRFAKKRHTASIHSPRENAVVVRASNKYDGRIPTGSRQFLPQLYSRLPAKIDVEHQAGGRGTGVVQKALGRAVNARSVSIRTKQSLNASKGTRVIVNDSYWPLDTHLFFVSPDTVRTLVCSLTLHRPAPQLRFGAWANSKFEALPPGAISINRTPRLLKKIPAQACKRLQMLSMAVQKSASEVAAATCELRDRGAGIALISSRSLLSL
jgi:hypothetical protein